MTQPAPLYSPLKRTAGVIRSTLELVLKSLSRSLLGSSPRSLATQVKSAGIPASRTASRGACWIPHELKKNLDSRQASLLKKALPKQSHGIGTLLKPGKHNHKKDTHADGKELNERFGRSVFHVQMRHKVAPCNIDKAACSYRERIAGESF